ncbi:alpha/beta fold hydrolase [Actinokineospora sp. UTMC 2448]|uniref:alpha/beta fold hydrolase n=1 Tax=Actinokineospora sp. UTMC 2448 TaxID=2268449 RepID=UPI002164A6AE|nr:alpha/beta hydrolase [Actinokineospora sp. UTMC 2448]UVS79093.1 acetoin dehydrogenase E2 subunit dihydrolipoyllysine-residue acetyltransferase [Actinokineospora sp. UTMC 2448]
MSLVRKSTIVRAKFTALKATFRVLERAAPNVGGALALRLWCTPRHARPAAAGTPGTRRRITVHGGEVLTETWGEGPTVYLAHGWGGHRGQLAGLVDPLVAAGYRVVAFDALSHGESGPGALGPDRSTLPEFAAALTAVVAESGPAHGIVAHSMGGTAAALAVLDGVRASRLALVAPVAEPIGQTAEFAKALGFGERVHAAMLRRLRRLAGRPLTDFDIPARAAGRADLPPLLVVHDVKDREVAHANGAAIAESWPGARLVTTEGLGHRRVLADQDVLRAVIGFVTAHEPAAAR